MAKQKKDRVNNPSLSRPLLAQSSSTSATNSQSDQPISPMPQPYNPNAAHSPTDYSSSHADTLSPSAPPPAYSHHDPATTSASSQQVQSYHQQPSRPTAQQMNNTHPAAVLVPMPVQRPSNIPVDYQPCVDGFAHKIRTDLTLSGVLCGILLFPIGLACMLTWLERRCTKCGRKFR